MACLLVKKHPQLSSLIKGPKWQLRVWLWMIQTVIHKSPAINFEQLETKILSQVGSCEARPQINIDKLYIQTLNYFFTKGLITGTFPTNVADQVNAIYAQKKLVPLLKEIS